MASTTIRTFVRRGIDAGKGIRHRTTGGRPDGDAAGNPKSVLKSTRRQLRHTRTKLVETRAKLDAVSSELKATRVSVRDPNPHIEVSVQVKQVIDRVREERLSYLHQPDLEMLARLVREIEESQRPGLIIEAGTARGGSAIVLAAAKDPERRMNVYDVFAMIPPPSENDGPDVHRRYEKITRGESAGVGGESYYGYRDDLYAEVTSSFERMGVPLEENTVSLVKGLFEDTIEIDEPVALAHLDGDWYESTMTCLERISPFLVPGGRLVLDDYYAWSGCRKAVDEYFADHPGFRVEKRRKVHVVRL